MKKGILSILLCLVIILGMAGCKNLVNDAKKDLEKAQKELEETYKKYGVVEKEKANVLVAKLNTEIMDSGLNTPAHDDYMMTQDDRYWYALTEEITFYVKPIKFSNSLEEDIVDMSAIYVEKEEFNEETATNYAKKLIKANNSELTDTEIETLLKDAKNLIKDKKSANNGKGISVGILDAEDHYEYQVIRLYK